MKELFDILPPFIALFLTLVIEGGLMWLIKRDFKWVKYSIYLNLVTNPILNLLLSLCVIFFNYSLKLSSPGFILAEIIIILVEGLLYHLMSNEKFIKTLLLSLCLNVISCLIGIILF